MASSSGTAEKECSNVMTWPNRISAVRPKPKYHQNHCMRSRIGGRGLASAGTSTNRNAIAASSLTSASMSMRWYMSEGGVEEVNEHAVHTAHIPMHLHSVTQQA